MSAMRNYLLIGLLAAAAGVAIGLGLGTAVEDSGGGDSGAAAQRKPLYWVAPMDPSYRRDAPGKSPMGMDLVPVYEEPVQEGTVSISPQVVNNLGVRTAPVTLRPLSTEIQAVGYVQYDQDRLVHIHPRVEGWIEKLFVKASGDPVTAGQPLYELYSPQLVSAQDEFLLALRRDNPRLVEAAEQRLQALQLAPEIIDTLRRERKVHQRVTFYAPQGGVVTNLDIREGFYVVPSTTLMSIGVLADVWVEAEVFERQAPLVAVGLPVTMTLDYLPGREWQGVVDYVYPSLDEKTRTLRVRLRFDNPDRLLRPNMFAQVLIHVEPVERALVVPREAVIRTGRQDRVVLALGQGRFRSRVVSLGRVDDQYVEIRGGLDEGDMVVVSAQFLLDSESSKGADLARMETPQAAPAETHSHSHGAGGGHD
jgi:Cu(I)/Ag(I) efflux system membrane fusion protein